MFRKTADAALLILLVVYASPVFAQELSPPIGPRDNRAAKVPPITNPHRYAGRQGAFQTEKPPSEPQSEPGWGGFYGGTTAGGGSARP